MIFTTEEDVIRIIQRTMLPLLIYIWFDTIHGVQSGIIRGLNRQTWGSWYTLICYWILGMPMALVGAFTLRLGVTGLWAGYAIACIILDIGFGFIIGCPDWSKIAKDLAK